MAGAVDERRAAYSDILREDQRRFLAGALGARIDTARIGRVIFRVATLDAVENVVRRKRRQPGTDFRAGQRRLFDRTRVDDPRLPNTILAAIDIGHRGP